MTNLEQFLDSKGFGGLFDLTLPKDGKVQRVARDGGNPNAWYRHWGYTIDGREITHARFGDWSTAEKYDWKSFENININPEEKARIENELQIKAIQARLEKETRQKKAALDCFEIWVKASQPELLDHGYLTAKFGGPVPNYGAKVSSSSDALLIPLRDIRGKLWSLQSIYLDASTQKFRKNFFPDGKIKSCFHTLIGDINHAKHVFISEGYATAVTVADALSRDCGLPPGEPYAVVSAFNSGNLCAVGEAIRGASGTARLIYCADDDAFTRRPDGSPWNPGLEKAHEAAQSTGGIVLAPRFTSPEKGKTDFDDLRQAEGVAAVISQIREQLSAPSGVRGSGAGVLEAPKKEAITEKRVVDALLGYYGKDLVRQQEALFQYDGVKWVELTKGYGIDQIKNHLNALCGDKLDSKKVNSLYATFFRYIPQVPEGVNLFVPNRSCGNFLDGTLRLNRDIKTGQYSLSFGPHSRTDFVTWVIPVHYQCDRSLKNAKWGALLSEVFQGDPDAEGKLRSIKQLGGSMLIPAFHQMFFFHGVSGSRKSTIGKTLAKLLHDSNVSAVDPSQMTGFDVSAMIGKLVNMKMDIDDRTPLARGFMKCFEDGTPFHVNRKNKDPVKSVLPMVHLYGANTLPPNFEGYCQALERRVTLIEFKNDLTHGGKEEGVIKFYEDIIFAEGYEGILNFMVEGLEDLISRGGKFSAPESGKAKLREWQAASDIVEQFLDAARAGELIADDKNTQMIVNDAARIRPNDLWEVFKKFHLNTAPSLRMIGRNKFYAALQERKYATVLVKGHQYYRGIGVEMAPGSGFDGGQGGSF